MQRVCNQSHPKLNPTRMLKIKFFPPDPKWEVPTPQECVALWDLYQMPTNIRKHCQLVGNLAQEITCLAKDKISHPSPQLALAAGLLHDLGKYYAIQHGGAHSQLGASLVRSHFVNPELAQAVIHHVYWPGEIDLPQYFLVLTIIYSDKRAKHDQLVSIEERFTDLFARYGTTPEKIKLIQKSKRQVLEIEQKLSDFLEVDLQSYVFRRLQTTG